MALLPPAAVVLLCSGGSSGAGGDRKIMASVSLREVRKRYGELEVIHGV
jgi:hypothetical protein